MSGTAKRVMQRSKPDIAIAKSKPASAHWKQTRGRQAGSAIQLDERVGCIGHLRINDEAEKLAGIATIGCLVVTGAGAMPSYKGRTISLATIAAVVVDCAPQETHVSEIDLSRLQAQYALAEKLLGRLDGDLDEAKGRLGEIAKIRRAYTDPDPTIEDYHQRTIDLLQRAMDRYGELYDLMLQSGTDAIKKMGER
jgi:hypothetical protein